MTTWTVPGRVTRVIDGDTLECDLSLGWHITYRAKVRLAGINCPELSVPAGVAARQWVIDTLHVYRFASDTTDFLPVMVVSHSLDKYGRVLADVSFATADGTEHIHLNSALITAGHAVVMR